MKFGLLVAGFLVTAAAAATPAFAEGPYVGASAGLSLFHDSDVSVGGITAGTISYNAGAAVNVGLGYNFDGCRLEGEFGYKKADIDSLSATGGRNTGVSDADAAVTSYMVNAYYDFKNSSAVTPFVGAGIGLLHGELSEPGWSTSGNTFGYQLMVGTGIKLSDNFNLDLSYRFQGAGGDFTMDGVDVGFNSSNIMAGVRYNF